TPAQEATIRIVTDKHIKSQCRFSPTGLEIDESCEHKASAAQLNGSFTVSDLLLSIDSNARVRRMVWVPPPLPKIRPLTGRAVGLPFERLELELIWQGLVSLAEVVPFSGQGLPGVRIDQ